MALIKEFNEYAKDNRIRPTTKEYFKYKLNRAEKELKELDEGFANAVYLDQQTAPDSDRG